MDWGVFHASKRWRDKCYADEFPLSDPSILIPPDGSCGRCQVVETVRRRSENANDPVKWLRLTGRLLIVGPLPLNLEDYLFDVLGNLIVHVCHRAPSQGRIRL
jgi:hypothetical protein